VCVSHPCRQLRKQKKEQEQREFEALQEQGLNPYEVYRVRDAEATAAHAAAQLAAVQRQRKADIAAALAAEDQAHRKVLAKQEFDRQVRPLALAWPMEPLGTSRFAASLSGSGFASSTQIGTVELNQLPSPGLNPLTSLLHCASG